VLKTFIFNASAIVLQYVLFELFFVLTFMYTQLTEFALLPLQDSI